MKKKIIIALTLIGILNLNDFAATPGIGNKVSGISDGKYRFFSGFDFGDIPSDKHDTSLTQRVNSEIDYVIADDIEKNNNEKYAIVGHSQGGLRVLAYATMLERRITDSSLSAAERQKAKANYNRLCAVITMSGIDKGLMAIENNFSTFKSKLIADGNIWLKGIRGVARVTITTTLIERTVMGILGISKAEDIIKFLPIILPGFGESYIMSGWNGESYSKIPEVYDMVPGSDFIKTNVSSSSAVIYKKQIGINIINNILFGHTEPVYAFFIAIKDNPKFSSSLPVGYVVGTDSNTLGLAEEKEAEIRKCCSVAADVFEVAHIINLAESYITGNLMGHYQAHEACCAARDWFRNVDDELNDLKGSSENDGLVAKGSQFYPKRFYNPVTAEYEEVHSNVLGKTSEGYVAVAKNHEAINCDKTFNDIVIPMIEDALNEDF